MRKIRFRGRLILPHTWVYGGIVIEGENAIIYPDETNGEVGLYIEPDTVGQYTGVNDDNGEEIYEGDILKAKDIFGNEFECVVVFDNNYHHAFGLRDICRSWYHFNFREIESMTIIGNIHDNPELFEEEKRQK